MKVKNILVSQPKPTSEKSPYYEMESKYGVKIDFHQFIKVEPVKAKEFRTQHVNILDYTAIIFNARHGIDHFFRLSEELRITIPDTMKYFCISETVALYLQKYIQYRKRKIFFSPTGKIDGLETILNKHNKEKYLYVTSNIRNEETMTVLEKSNINFEQAIMYKTVPTEYPKDKPFNYDLILFFSPSGITSLKENFPKFEQKDTLIGCFGKNTAVAIEEAGLRLDLQAPAPGMPSMTMVLENFLKENKKPCKKK